MHVPHHVQPKMKVCNEQIHLKRITVFYWICAISISLGRTVLLHQNASTCWQNSNQEKIIKIVFKHWSNFGCALNHTPSSSCTLMLNTSVFDLANFKKIQYLLGTLNIHSYSNKNGLAFGRLTLFSTLKAQQVSRTIISYHYQKRVAGKTRLRSSIIILHSALLKFANSQTHTTFASLKHNEKRD